jgi:transposase
LIGLPSGSKVWIATGHTDMRKGLIGLAGMVKQTLLCDPLSGHLFVFRGRKGDRIKVLWWDGQGMCLFYKLLERGHFVWPQGDTGKIQLTQAQLAMLLEGIDWRILRRTSDRQYLL